MSNQSETIEFVNRPIEKSQLELVNEDPELKWLNRLERAALAQFRENYQRGDSNTRPLSTKVQGELFSLFLQGRTLGEIREQNPGMSLGQIVESAVEGGWNQQKKEYQAGLLSKARDRLQQVACESVIFLADQLAVAHKFHGVAMQKYLQSGDMADLKGFEVASIKQYRDVAELLLKLTTSDNTTAMAVNKLDTAATQVGQVNIVVERKSLMDMAALKKQKETPK